MPTAISVINLSVIFCKLIPPLPLTKMAAANHAAAVFLSSTYY